MPVTKEQRLRDVAAEQPEEQIFINRRVETPVPLDETSLTERVDLGGERASDSVQMLSRGRELLQQEWFVERDPATQWTLQQYSTNPSGEPWFALQKQDESGALHTVTGTRAELDHVIAEHGLKPLELPPAAPGSVELSLEIRPDESLGVGV